MFEDVCTIPTDPPVVGATGLNEEVKNGIIGGEGRFSAVIAK